MKRAISAHLGRRIANKMRSGRHWHHGSFKKSKSDRDTLWFNFRFGKTYFAVLLGLGPDALPALKISVISEGLVLSFCAGRDAEQEGYDLACAAFEIHNVLGYSMAEEIKGDIYEGLMAKSGRKEH